MLQKLISWDKSIFLKINQFHSPWVDKFMQLVSVKHSYFIYLPLLFIIYRKTSLKYCLKLALGCVVTFAACDLVAARIFKPNFMRLRPCHDETLAGLVRVVDGCGGQFGFVSNHATNHFGLGVFVGLVFEKFYPKSFRYFLLFPILVAYSRIYMGVHFPGDVLAGAVMGTCIAFIVHSIFSNHLAVKR